VLVAAAYLIDGPVVRRPSSISQWERFKEGISSSILYVTTDKLRGLMPQLRISNQ
jgi:hypothetical protein